MSELQAGQEVRVFDVNGKRAGQPEGGWRGEVVKVGRTLVYIAYSSWFTMDHPQAFRIEGGRSNDAYAHQWFLTLAEAEAEERAEAAKAILRKHRITVGFGASLTLGQLEALAAVFKED